MILYIADWHYNSAENKGHLRVAFQSTLKI